MKKPEFLFLLLGASYSSYRFAQKYVKDRLKTDFRYDVILNNSYDENDLERFEVFPEDNDKKHYDLTENEVVEILCRNNKIPVWIDIGVSKSNKKFTTFNLLCAGRYSEDPNEYYYKRNGSGPFGIKSPIFPINYKEGKKFWIKNSNNKKKIDQK